MPEKQTVYYPAGRLDYTLTEKLRFSLSANFTKSTNLGAYPDPLPGPYFQTKTTGNTSKSYVVALGIDYNITPNVLNCR